MITLIEKWKKSADNDEALGTLFTDLSKAFDSLSQLLLNEKLNVYGFYSNAIELINSYLSNRKERVRKWQI